MKNLLINTTFSDYLCWSCFLGAFGQEILHWYNLKIELKDQVKFYKSTTYWVIAIVSIIFFGLTAKLLAEFVFKEQPLTSGLLFITALAYPIIVKQALKLITKSIGVQHHKSEYTTKNLGNTLFEINDYFKNY